MLKYISIQILERITKSNNVLFYVPIGTNASIINRAKKCFKLKNRTESTRIFDALNGVTEELHSAIKDGNAAKVERILDIYLSLLECFLERTSTYNIHYDQSTASQSFLSWFPTTKMIRDIDQSSEFAIANKNIEVIDQFAYFPKQVFALSVEYNDHFLTNQFKTYLPFMYYIGSRSQDKRVSEFVIGRCSSNLNDLALFFTYKLERSESLEKARVLSDYVNETILSFNQLLKTAIDNLDIDSFRKFGTSLDEVMKYTPTPRFELENKLFQPNISDEEKRLIQEKLEISKHIETVKENIENMKLLVWFGLGGWITYLYDKGKIAFEQFKPFFDQACNRLSTLEILSETYATINQSLLQPKHEFGWNFWEFDDEDIHNAKISFGINEWLGFFFCLRGIMLSPVTAGSHSLTPSPLLRNENQKHESICQKIGNEAKFTELVPEEINEKINAFLLLNKQAIAEQKIIDKKWITEQPINAEMVQEFSKSAANAYLRGSEMYRAIKALGRTKSYSKLDAQAQQIAASNLIRRHDKAAFVKGWHTAYSGFERYFGETMGNIDDKRILETIGRSIDTNQRCKPEEICKVIHSTLCEMSINGITANLIVIRDRATLRFMKKDIAFKRDGLLDFAGSFEGFPIIISGNCSSDCLVMNIALVGNLTECMLTENEPFIETTVEPIDDALAKKMIDQNKNLLKDANGKEVSLDGATAVLKLQVLITVSGKKEFVVTSRNQGKAIFFDNSQQVNLID